MQKPSFGAPGLTAGGTPQQAQQGGPSAFLHASPMATMRMEDEALQRLQGWMLKKVSGLKQNKRRWFCLAQAATGGWELKYSDGPEGQEKGVLPLQGCDVHPSPKDKTELMLRGPLFAKKGKVYRLQCSSAAECTQWIEGLREAGSAGKKRDPPRGRGLTLTGESAGGAAAAAHGVMAHQPAAQAMTALPNADAAPAAAPRPTWMEGQMNWNVSCNGKECVLEVNRGAQEVIVRVLVPGSPTSPSMMRWQMATGFSFVKPVRSDRSLDLILRGRALVADGPKRKVDFASCATVSFKALAHRECCCSFLAKLRPGSPTPESETTIPSHPLKLFCGTWNVGEKPPPDDMQEWLGPAQGCELAVIAAQECNYKARDRFANTDDDWCGSIIEALNHGLPRGNWFATAETVCMTDPFTKREMRILVAIKEQEAWRMGDATAGREATGLMHVGGNKGGLCIAMRVMDTPFCFIASHLAAHQGELMRRASDISEIIEGVSKSIGTHGVDVTNEYPYCVWLGDLNYRIDTVADSGNLRKEDPEWFETIRLRDAGQVRELIEQRNWGLLWEDDQLRKAMGRSRVSFRGGVRLFPGFREAGDPAFPPTFKCVPRSKIEKEGAEPGYDRKRVPSWCDRVLFSQIFRHPVDTVTPERYYSAPSLDTSDHKPVGSVLCLRVREQWPGHYPSRPCRLAVTLSNLSATHLLAADAGGTSDPYLEVTSHLFASITKTSVEKRTLNPVWKDTVRIPADIGNLAFADTQYLIFRVYDHDRVGEDDPLGQCVLSLHELCDGQQHQFERGIVRYGVQQGSLRGVIQVEEVAAGVPMPVGQARPRNRSMSPLGRLSIKL
eukprot:Hpha_TRINITY_DN18404_c0_g1::TRINITY_DN18404_c0_g1_i1::g.165386::m.165386